MGREKYDSGTVTFETTSAIPRGSLVKLDAAGTISIAAITEKAIGTAAEEGYASGQRIGVDLLNKPGTHIGIAAGAFAVGAVVNGQNNGQIDDATAGSALRVGIALEAATAAGDEVMFLVDRPA